MLATKSNRKIPGPTSFPVIGNMIQVNRSGGLLKLGAVLKKFQKQYGDVFRIKLGPAEMICFAHPDKIEEIFRNDEKFPRRDPPPPAWTEYHRKHNMSDGVFHG